MVYLGRQGQSQIQQPQRLREFFECGGTGNVPQQGYNSMVPASVALQPTYPARAGGQTARGGIIPVCYRDASVLFDPGSTYSYVSSYFASYLDMYRDSLSAHVYMSTPVGDSIMVDRVYRACLVIIGSCESRVDLLTLHMVDFDVILGMDWLLPYHTILDCHAKTVTLAFPGLP
ncbi:uncharacterized protein [Nicotiana tomentosiformis]|uniref:uncharacterized protein n=1 Tax=Nicotiana tomentosiformis TaxID=4098 RepID=UPI00388C8891